LKAKMCHLLISSKTHNWTHKISFTSFAVWKIWT
jgi:hypothetical protein